MATRKFTFGSFAPGVNNRLEPTQLDTRLPDRSKARFLYGGTNVDINEKGFIRRRRGQTETLSSPTHSIWSTPPFTEMFGVVNDQLARMYEGGTGVARDVLVPFMPRIPVSFSRGEDGDVYWTNELDLRRVSGGVDEPAWTAPPPRPAITVGTAGALPAGQYLLAVTATQDGVESPVAEFITLQVPANGHIDISSTVPINVYLSGTNGDTPTLQYSGSLGSIFVPNDAGRRSDSTPLATMPPGSIVRHYNGRMLVAAGPNLFVSEPYRYGVFDPTRGYFGFSGDITVLEPTDNGLYIAADRTFWVGDLFSDALQEVLPYGAVAGSSVRSADDETVYWQSERGLIRADKNMAVTNVQEDALAIRGGREGATLFREVNGQTHVVATRSQVPETKAVAFTYMDAEIVRKGTDL